MPADTPRTDALFKSIKDADYFSAEPTFRRFAEQLERALSGAERERDELKKTVSGNITTDIQEWIWHLDLHLTEHDLQHAGKALRAAWPTVRDFFTSILTSPIQWKQRAERAEAELALQTETAKGLGRLVAEKDAKGE